MMNIPPATAAPDRRQKLCTPSTDVQPPSPAPSPPGYDYYLSTPPDSFSQVSDARSWQYAHRYAAANSLATSWCYSAGVTLVDRHHGGGAHSRE
jgi:hypothetical protein